MLWGLKNKGKKFIGSREPENIKKSTIFKNNTSKWVHLQYMGDTQQIYKSMSSAVVGERQEIQEYHWNVSGQKPDGVEEGGSQSAYSPPLWTTKPENCIKKKSTIFFLNTP